MPRDDLKDSFAFVNEPGGSSPSPRPKKRQASRWPARLGVLAVLGIAVAWLSHAATHTFSSWETLIKGDPPRPQLAARPSTPPPPISPHRPEPPRRLPRAGNRPVAWNRMPMGGDPSRPNRPPQERRDEPEPEDPPPAPNQVALDLLQSKGIIRQASGFTLKSEDDARTKLTALRERAEEFNAAYERLFVTRRIAALAEMMTEADARVAGLNIQMGRFRTIRRNGVLFHGMTTDDNALYEQLRAERDAIVLERDTAWRPELQRLRRLPGPGPQKAETDFKSRTAAALDALKEMEDVVAETKRDYDQLPKDDAIRRALARFPSSRFGPSPEFNNSVRELEVFQKSVRQKPASPTQKKRGRPRKG